MKPWFRPPCALALALLAGACACRHPDAERPPRAGGVNAAPASTASTKAVPAAAAAPAVDLTRWIEDAPEEAAVWIARQPSGPGLDARLAAVSTHPDILVSSPAFAADQAARIVDADLRRATLAEVVSTWGRIDVAAARERVMRLDRIDDIERSHLHELLADIAAMP